VHRLSDGETNLAVRVIVAPLTEAQAEPDRNTPRFQASRIEALKKLGAYGNKVRSRIESHTGPGLILQNGNIIAANLELIARLGPAWQTGAQTSDDIVRRYNQNPFLLRDEHFGKTAKADILKPHRFNELLSSASSLWLEDCHL
jgi:hypothetical protein